MADALTTVALVRDYLEDQAADSDLITSMIAAAQAWIARYCNREDTTGNGVHWGTATRTEYLSGNLSEYVMLKFTPITGVTSVDLVTGASTSVSVATTGLTVDGLPISGLAAGTPGSKGKLAYRRGTSGLAHAFDSGRPMGPFYGGPHFGDAENGVKVVYTGGYTTIPGDLTFACTMVAANMYRSKSLNPNLKSENLGSYAYTRSDGAGKTPGIVDVDDLLATYRRYTI